VKQFKPILFNLENNFNYLIVSGRHPQWYNCKREMEGIAMRSEIHECGIEIIQGDIVRVYFVRIPMTEGMSFT